jgi:magnesium-transporting ATPase (P-type)
MSLRARRPLRGLFHPVRRQSEGAGTELRQSGPDAARLAGSTPQERLQLLGSRWQGLGIDEAAARLRRVGPNTPVAARRRRPLPAFAANFTHTLALLLWFAAGLSFAAGLPELGFAIIAVVAVNGVFAYIQEHRAERVVEGLMRRVAVRARVRRDGHEQHLPAAGLVPGDVIRLAAGDIVPADAVLLAADNLTLDLSMLTGETLPVERSAAEVTAPAAHASMLDLPCMTPAGAAVIAGTGDAVVSATGPASSVGQIAALVEGVHRAPSLLERQIAELSRLTVIIAVTAGALSLSLAALFTEMTILAALTFATGVIVALVPEGLLPTLNVSLAIGAARMADRGAAVRRLSAVEIVGSATVICTDKTGTLTRNALAVSGFHGPDGATEPAREALLAAALCNEARRLDNAFEGDPIDVALAAWARQRGADPAVLRDRHPRLGDVPFSAERRYMAVTCTIDGRPYQLVKGAPEAVLALAGTGLPPALAADLNETAERGDRVLMLAGGPATCPPAVLGIVSLHDPPRAEVPAAIAACRRAGVRVVMLTGDHPATACSVAAQIGLAGGSVPVLDGEAIDAASDAELLAVLRGNAILARTDPRQKLRIVTLLQRAGDVVVVTGDGINDAPALRAADVGVAMGRRGTEVAKQAADIVLSDDNFATIVAAIEEGRSIKRNIRRFVSYVFTSNVAEVLPFLLYVFLPIPLPLAIMQVLAIDLGTDLLPALALGVEPASAGTLNQPPEPPRRPLLTPPLLALTFLFFGPIEAALGLAGFFGVYVAEGWQPFESLASYADVDRQAMTLTFLGIVAGQIGCLIAQRDGSLRARLSTRRNRWLLLGLGVEVALALLLVYVPGLNRTFSMTAVAPVWLLILPLGAAAFVLLDLARRSVPSRIRDAAAVIGGRRA